MKHLRSPAWETRIAASQAVEAILANVPEWQPPPFTVIKEETLDPDDGGRLRCETFDLERVLQDGASLMGSEGNEYDMEEEALSTTDLKERISRQRQQLNAKLGLDVAPHLGVDINALYTNEDLCPIKPAPKPDSQKKPVQELVPSKPLSSREMNLAKRKARLAFSKQKSRDCSEEGGPSAPPTPPIEPDRKKIKTEPNVDDYLAESAGGGAGAVPDCAGAWGACARWPLERWSAALRAQLFSAAWEARHGAASALRELLRARVASTAGVHAGMTTEQMEDAHQEWLEDIALRLICVLALDRFGDFVSDQVVAPVRETCAQTLGVALACMRVRRVRLVCALLAALAQQPQWEARHGALLAYKYLLAARKETGLECGAVEQLVRGLEDDAEDVSAAAAAALTAHAGAASGSARALAARLWALLRDQDELAAPANAYLALLAALCTHTRAATHMQYVYTPHHTTHRTAPLAPIDLPDVLPRLWPYLDHSTSSVRKAALQTLRTLTRPLVTETNGTSNGNGSTDSRDLNGKEEQYLAWTPELLQEAMRHVYQRILFEHVHDIQEIALQVWENFLRHASLGAILVAACPVLATWMCLAMQPARAPVDCALLLRPPLQACSADARLVVLGLAAHYWERRVRSGQSCEGEARVAQKWYVGGSEAQPCHLRDRNVTRARCLAAQALGFLSCYLVQPAPGIEYKPEDESPIDCYVKVMVVYLRSGSALQRLVAALVVSMWARHTRTRRLFPPTIQQHQNENEDMSEEDSHISKLAPPLLVSTLHAALNQTLYYDEVAINCNRQSGSDAFTHLCVHRHPFHMCPLAAERILQEARDLHAMMKHYKLPVDTEEFNNILRLEQVSQLTEVSGALVAAMKVKRVAHTLEERRAALHAAVAQCCAEQNTLNVQVQAALAGACANLHCLPEKLNPVIRPLMESIKKEPSEELQHHSAATLAELLEQLVTRDPCPNNKVLVNLKAFLRCDPEVTPRVSLECSDDGDSASDSGPEAQHAPTTLPALDRYKGILTLREQQRQAEAGTPRRGRPPAHQQQALQLINHEDEVHYTTLHYHYTTLPLHYPTLHYNSHLNNTGEVQSAEQIEAHKILKIQRRGATLALVSLTKHFNNELPEKLPKLWEFIIEPLDRVMTDAGQSMFGKRIRFFKLQECTRDLELESADVEATEEMISRLQVFEAVCAHLGGQLWARVGGGGPRALCALTRALHTALRHMAARALAAVAARQPAAAMHAAIHELVPGLGEVRCERTRCGAAEALSRVVDALQLQVVPYIVLLVVPLLGRMSDHCEAVRVMSTRCFASLIQLMPLDGAVPEPPDLSPDMRERRNRDKNFLDKLFNPKTIENYKIPVPVTADLRTYQQAGVNWLRFLYSYKLHGVLCDDMGLGKTLQSIVAVASSHWERAQTRAPSLPSLVVCPPTLTGTLHYPTLHYTILTPCSPWWPFPLRTGSEPRPALPYCPRSPVHYCHWVFEVNKFIPSNFLKPLQYVGPPIERERLRAHVKHHNLIVASYDIVRKDIDFFSSIKWNYCVLDEGHVIKNGKTKAFKAIKQLIANHRLILSGTPIQNNVLELWSLFDFLMPGLLGTERQFTARYSRPILAARDPRANPAQLQAGALACEALHRQVLPFLLRRVKEDVLKELPPKITQDYYCELSPLQRRLYEHFSRDHMPDDVTSRTHVFQALHYLQNVCNHPKLVLTAEHPEYERVTGLLQQQRSTLDDIQHAAKLPALKQLLLECGIGGSCAEGGGGGGPGGGGAAADVGEVVAAHRALVFCQLKRMLDIVERDLLQRHLPSVTYLRLDGSVPPPQRHAIVSAFNADVTIDLLLLTTAVGGLGLNLTGADTVIFVEHDWNPMKDLQAMDRAHRIGQRRVVNVYRLITRDTLEEKIMGLQKFKLMTANTVISSENAALETMGTDQLLDLFQPPGTAPKPSYNSFQLDASNPAPELPPDLWDDAQYEEEYDMTSFIKSLNKIGS
ncbi:unnamed protein product [Diatraea saccharalis]|uniref:TATA-binding protein-associated factor 172 n=1 Tax=Diatraea saccharalis TaxID=40085 RepID=A0A9P0FZ47_9NEOP|nr:unnamed protein product [Diatraea saccharalis]